jgi:DNA invertase Pin-like site-specific DNA recombinase
MEKVNTVMPTAIIYCRVSNVSADRDNNTGLEQQEQACRAYCDQKGYNVLEVIRETASGATLERPGIWSAIDTIRYGRADRVVVYALDRLSRDQTHQAVLIHAAEEKYGGKVESTREDYDNTATGALLRSIAGHVAEMERVNVVARMARGKLARVLKDKLLTSANPTYGYRWADDVPGQRTRYEIDETAAAIVRRIFALCLSGSSIRGIARTLNIEGVPTPAQHHAGQGHIGRRKVGTAWEPVQILRILRESSYIGQKAAYHLQSGVEHVKDATTGEMRRRKTVQVRTDGRIPLSPVTCPAIISESDFYAVQTRLADNKQFSVRNNHNPEALLLRGGILVCGGCGATMRGQRRPGRDTWRYMCPNRSSFNPDPRTACPSPTTVEAPTIDVDVWADVSAAYDKPDASGMSYIQRAVIRQVKDITERDAALAARLSEAESKAQHLERQRDNLRASLAETSNQSTRTFLVGQLDKLQEEIDGLDEYRAELGAAEAEVRSHSQWVQSVIARIQPVQKLDQFGYDDKRGVLRLLGVKVVLYREPQANGKRWVVAYDIELQSPGVP